MTGNVLSHYYRFGHRTNISNSACRKPELREETHIDLGKTFKLAKTKMVCVVSEDFKKLQISKSKCIVNKKITIG